MCAPCSSCQNPPQFKLHQERVKTCNPKPTTVFKKLFKGYSRCPALLKNQSGQLPLENKNAFKHRMIALSHPFPSRVSGRKWREWRRNRRKYEKMKKSRKEPVMKMMVEHHFTRFLKRRNYSSGVGDALHFSKNKVGSYQNPSTRPEIGNQNLKKRNNSHREFFSGKWKEYGRKRQKNWNVGKTNIAKSQVEYHFVRLPKSRNYSRGIGDALRFSKSQVGS